MTLEAVLIVWSLSGIAAHVLHCERVRTWGGTPVWREPSTYVMFIPAMIVGPILFFL